MANTFEPRIVPSDVIVKWPGMALALWRRSFKHQVIVLLAAAFVIKVIPDWWMTVSFVLAPSLFLVCFQLARSADEYSTISWSATLEEVLPGVLRLGKLTLKIAFYIALGMALAILLAESLADTVAPADGPTALDQPLNRLLAPREPDNIVLQFLYFCATWIGSTMSIASFGMFVIVIYQGVFGAVLHAQEGLGDRASRIFAWRAWACNVPSIETAVREASPRFWRLFSFLVVGFFASAQTVYLSFLDLVFLTYIPCIAYVAYRSIFYGKNQNVPAGSRAATTAGRSMLAPSLGE